MAVCSQIPIFGNWENDIPYPLYLDNARNEISCVRINPSDPLENRDAFEEKDASQDDSDCEPKSIEDVIKISSSPEKARFPGEKQNGNGVSTNAITRSYSDRLRIEIYYQGASNNEEEKPFTGSQIDGLGRTRASMEYSKVWQLDQ
ncbi:hypothetical protein MLD38_009764 [Melastoma candidum]|uniref:Uncharacterized protein n=1 Tax=Melastoma candidum TaxID=119954 RepID=A0ACB9RZW3_9MYRT|nr:hypothetical protein MLD38_009764 [Melastoma candidum]